MGKSYGKIIWENHMGKSYGKIIWENHMGFMHDSGKMIYISGKILMENLENHY